MEESKSGGIQEHTSVLSASNSGTRSERSIQSEGIQGCTSVRSAKNLGIKSASRSTTDSDTGSDLTWDIMHKSGRDWTTSATSDPTVKESTDSSSTESSGSSNSCVSSQGSRSEEYQEKFGKSEPTVVKKVSSLKPTDEKKLDKENMIVERPVAAANSVKQFYNIEIPCLTMEESKSGGIQEHTSVLSASNSGTRSNQSEGIQVRTS